MATHIYILHLVNGQRLQIRAPKNINVITLCSLVKIYNDITVTLFIESIEQPLNDLTIVPQLPNLYAIPS